MADPMIRLLLPEVPGWSLRTTPHLALERTFVHEDFVTAMKFVNAMADVAEAEGHHPDFAVHWNRVEVSIWTHAAQGLTDNDFILAAKIDAVAAAPGATGSGARA